MTQATEQSGLTQGESSKKQVRQPRKVAHQEQGTMTSNETPSAVQSGPRLSRTRSFPNAVTSLLFNHKAWSSTDTENIPQPSNQKLTTGDQRANNSTAVFGLLGAHYEQDSFNWVDPDTNFCKASPPSSSPSMRRSETWTTSFQRPNDLSQNASRPTNETSAGNGSRSTSATGSSSLRALQRSLSEVFGPNKVVINVPQEARHETPEVAISQSSAVARTSTSFPQSSRMSAPSTSDVSRATSLTAESGQTHPKSVLRRQTSLAAVPESDPTREVLQSSVHPNVEAGHPKARFSLPGASGATTVDENQNAVGHRNFEDPLNMAAGEMTSQDHVMQVPETAFSRPSRRFGIMDLLGGAGEKKKVRNKDVNLMAPQSW